MTTNVTSFFRESHHFDFLSAELKKRHEDVSPFKIWSAGCSSGEEPYSIALTCFDQMKLQPKLQVEITATDLDSQVLQKASNGVYSHKDVQVLSDSELKRWFLKGKGQRQGQVRIISEAQKLVRFSKLNLKNEWEHQDKFDVIFCRNVMIYFDNHLRTKLLEKFHHSLKPGGFLILGHSESLFGLSTKFSVEGRTIHRKLAAETAQGAAIG